MGHGQRVLAEGYFAGGTPTGGTHGQPLAQDPPFQSPFKINEAIMRGYKPTSLPISPEPSQTLTPRPSQEICSKGFLIHTGNPSPTTNGAQQRIIRNSSSHPNSGCQGRRPLSRPERPTIPPHPMVRFRPPVLFPPRRSNDVQNRMLLAKIIVCRIVECCGRHSNDRREYPGSSTRHRCWSRACLAQPVLFALLSEDWLRITASCHIPSAACPSPLRFGQAVAHVPFVGFAHMPKSRLRVLHTCVARCSQLLALGLCIRWCLDMTAMVFQGRRMFDNVFFSTWVCAFVIFFEGRGRVSGSRLNTLSDWRRGRLEMAHGLASYLLVHLTTHSHTGRLYNLIIASGSAGSGKGQHAATTIEAFNFFELLQHFFVLR
ncbi:hypothetical protein QBC41DRAFT_94695 [Cercophora samala]|uniref:Uncharacterized protein n=1 Tax=Cercophora samala TaxID=330535 RepID=A0AA40DBG2_9PEZI|nr:hypothetical protein QBC41DRAFT_94695 [Cercophora samala]